MTSFSLAAAQTVSVRGDLEQNMREHLRLADAARRLGARLVLFPELSLTGYEPDLADRLAYALHDPGLEPFRRYSREHGLTLVIGAPVRLGTGLHIGSFVVMPDGGELLYTKRYLHPGEEKVFSPGCSNPRLHLEAGDAALAICADITNPAHPARAAAEGASLYLVSILTTVQGYHVDASFLSSYAAQYGMITLMANHGGDSGGYHSAGKSALWGAHGELIAALPGRGEGLVLATVTGAAVTGSVVVLDDAAKASGDGV